MEDKRISGLLVYFFYDGSVFQEILQRKRNHQSIRSLEEFIYDLQTNKCTNRKKLEDISKTVTAAVMINSQNNLITLTCQSEYSNAIDAIFRFILNLPCMITWISNIGGYFMNHPVPATQAKEFIRSASLFINLITGDLLKNHPTPALILQLIRQESANVIPSLEINVGAKTNDQQIERKKYCLQTIICLNSQKELTAFIRQNKSSSEATWTLIEVQEWNNFIKIDLPGFEKQLRFIYNLKNLELVQDDRIVHHILYMMKTCIFLVYVPIQIPEEVHEAASSNVLVDLGHTEEKAEQDNQPIEARQLQIGNMQITDDEVARSSLSIIPDEVETLIGICGPIPPQDPHLSSNLVDLNRRTESEQRRISAQTGISTADVLTISDCLLHLMQSYRTSLFHILRAITEKLKAKASEGGYPIPEDIQAITLTEFMDWNERTPSSSLSPFCSVWNKLVELAEGATSNNTCIDLHVSVRWISVRKLYDNYVGRKETSPHGLVISIQRSVGGQEPVLIDTTISALTLKGKKTLQLFSVMCSIKDEGLVTFTFDSGKDCWTKKLANGKVQALERTDSYYLGFLPTEEINVLSDNEILQNHSIGIIYTNK